MVADASHIVRDENIATRAILVREIPVGWWRVHMCWSGKTKTVDLPTHMLRKIKKVED